MKLMGDRIDVTDDMVQTVAESVMHLNSAQAMLAALQFAAELCKATALVNMADAEKGFLDFAKQAFDHASGRFLVAEIEGKA